MERGSPHLLKPATDRVPQFLMNLSPRKSAHYVESIVREAVARVARSLHRPLRDAGYDGPRSQVVLSDVQHDFLAGYIYGALQRLLELGELCEEEGESVAQATHRLYCGFFGFTDNDYAPWHAWVVREGLHHLQRPHVFLGYCTGRNDVVAQLRHGGRRNALADALRHLGDDNREPLFGVG